MDGAVNQCGCKGVRFCQLCADSDRVKQLKTENVFNVADQSAFVFCHHCLVGHKLPDERNYSYEELLSWAQSQQLCDGHSLTVDTVVYLPDFVSTEEEANLVEMFDRMEWKLSQSGRRKQEWGPKVNFKQKKLRLQSFTGMPDFSREILGKMAQRSTQLNDYTPLELCNLEYNPCRGSSIEFHVDDTWIWGERLISINLLSGSVMSLWNEKDRQLVYVPMDRLSLICMRGHIRYAWKHSVMSHHIVARRIALTMREPEADFLQGGKNYNPELLQLASMVVSVK